jgi:purine-binding chemotaxis protein CheW
MSEAGTYVTVAVGRTRYCFDVHEVREIVPEPHVTTVPGALPEVGGVINVRGRVMALVDLQVALGGPVDEASDRTALVVDDAVAGDVAIGVDRVLDVVELDGSDLQPPPPFGLAGAAPFAEAVVELSDGLAVVLSLHRLLAHLGVRASAEREPSPAL